jgi:hypothetical protein
VPGCRGRGLREISRHLGWGLHSVQRYDRAATWQEFGDDRWKAPRASKLDPFKPYLDEDMEQHVRAVTCSASASGDITP